MKDDNAENRNVVSMWARRKSTIFAALTQVEAYWDALREDDGVPPRSAVDPRGIEDALEYAFILECVAPGVAKFRLAGMHLSDLMGMEVRGVPVTAMFLPEARGAIGRAIAGVCATPQVSHLVLTADRSIGRPALEARMLLAPLTDDFGVVNRILGCLQSVGQIGRQPRRFALTDLSARALSIGSAPPVPSQPERIGFAEEPGSFRDWPDAKTPDVTRPGLRLVKNDD